ncbi:MAG: hypothetical protein JKY54_14020 [Flavobacteriales bacterium]|nr:hypothetical protein [Flavobacteriales bacterium]
MNKLKGVIFLMIGLCFISSCSLIQSNGEKPRYTNYKGFKPIKSKCENYPNPDSDRGNFETNESKQIEAAPKEQIVVSTLPANHSKKARKKRRGGEMGMFLFIAAWLTLAIGSIWMFVVALNLGWATWAVIASGVLMGIVWICTLAAIFGLVLWMRGGGRNKPMLKDYDDKTN